MAVAPEVAVLVFPGTNCERETARAIEQAGGSARLVWHDDNSLGSAAAVVIPGGFSYGDYLRAGALARVSPIMTAVKEFATAGRPVLGICNGFQVLLEAGMLPGALLTNASLNFVHRWQPLTVESSDPLWWNDSTRLAVFPIAHQQGNYFASPELLKELEQSGQILFRYRNDDRWPEADDHPNGSIAGVAGIRNVQGNILGMMPHPERACSTDNQALGTGRVLFRSLLNRLCQEAV